MRTYQLPGSGRLTYFCWILYRESSHATTESLVATTLQPIEKASKVMDEEYVDAMARKQKETAQYLVDQQEAEKLLKLVCSTFASLG